MSNEELAALIQQGQSELYPVLWAQVRGLVVLKARKRYFATDGLGGVEVDDLIQSGFLALVEAVRYFDPAGEYKFTTILSNCLKTAFAAAGGYQTNKRNPLDSCRSLDAPLGDEPDGDTWMDTIAAPGDAFAAVEHRIWLEELHKALETALEELPKEERETITRRYYLGQTAKETGEAAGVSGDVVRKREYKGLTRLCRCQELSRFVEDRTPYYAHVGPESFNRTHTSAVEVAVIKRDNLAATFRE